MTVSVGEKAVYNGTFPVGTVLALKEDTTTASTTPAGVAWGSHTFAVGDQNTNSLTIEDQKSTAVTLRNSADPAAVEEGDFTVTKALAGDGDFSKSTFEFTYTCTDGSEGSLTVTGAATSEKSKKVKAGSTCTITEDAQAADVEGYTLKAPASQEVTIGEENQVVATTFTNTYTAKPSPSPSPSESPSPDPSDPATPEAGRQPPVLIGARPRACLSPRARWARGRCRRQAMTSIGRLHHRPAPVTAPARVETPTTRINRPNVKDLGPGRAPSNRGGGEGGEEDGETVTVASDTVVA
ncbi:DUF5979 domain-containing protein [Actinomyces johnsonii]|uniref:DUF5979 domain-containing protein n=1 Tax=Actinomyces johnsonii TaxID=544581 RepID=UPI001B86D889|nr:DUF5979 domain-containing protein [Actinomyces johnsonii]